MFQHITRQDNTRGYTFDMYLGSVWFEPGPGNRTTYSLLW